MARDGEQSVDVNGISSLHHLISHEIHPEAKCSSRSDKSQILGPDTFHISPESKVRNPWGYFFRRLFGCVRYEETWPPKRNRYTEPTVTPESVPITVIEGFLPPILNMKKQTLILDLDETLVHSSFTPMANYDMVVPVTLGEQSYSVYVRKRPHVDEFLLRVNRLFEVVVFTASLSLYADPVITQLDQHKTVTHRLFRQHCIKVDGGYVKDLSFVGRDLRHTIIVDNCPHSYCRQPDNAIPISSWFGDDDTDTSLIDKVLPLLENIAQAQESVYEMTRLTRSSRDKEGSPRLVDLEGYNKT
uniref:FCP1 homology domain-containing protein n=1 Tax=Spongospora subterranea TaxID=70186 RepID=A0A0H5RTP3_9EUKA|eukprot:CRZ12114.1 hypothetical protein [Spongospora subterranea]